MSVVTSKGKVILAAAGPGDPELVTMKAARYLGMADVVLTDRLVSEKILEQFVSPRAEIISVGKQCRRGVSTPQETINELLVEYALQGKFVVRLKGGDVSIFSNILDELEILKANEIEYEIVPGVTAALGAAAYAGIPLTARGYSIAVRFLTYYKSDVVSEEYWKELAETNDTLVLYMSSETLATVVEKLRQYNISPDKLLAVAEQATTPMQNIHISSFDGYEEKLAGKKFLSPSLVIIGKVVALHQQFAWLQNSGSTEYYFEPLVAKVNSITDNQKAGKHVSRA
ncbi:uroporphyrinogen-III C-methyltransferase [Ferruginibacter sp. HRS2-29]|uniref:uroporphyrinogen-III C-methyltransferase n=1 Tax=Ferruginibacter sp. HRS2-29 TaxID=2487334 RepID=UPI0020CCE5BA|nr:uroporphyrinogen-III C-methyltransferase [Ferruginibacter sp. HRS2-29]MCP9751127.1 uroporphyrinogen-III C-methyltransferase [Ferruginibacter sp. HRS2-29]